MTGAAMQKMKAGPDSYFLLGLTDCYISATGSKVLRTLRLLRLLRLFRVFKGVEEARHRNPSNLDATLAN